MGYPHHMRCALCRYAVRKPTMHGVIIISGCQLPEDDEMDTTLDQRNWINVMGCATMQPFERDDDR